MPPLVIAGLALAAAQVGKGIADKVKANKIKTQYTPYQVSPYVQEQLGTARQMMNGRMNGAATEERNIDTGQASYNSFIEKNASSGAQALALAATGQSRANEAYSQLAMKEQQNKYGLLANLNQAYAAMTNEDDKVYQSKLGKYNIDINQKRALNTSGEQNIFSGLQSGISLAGMAGAKTPIDLDGPQLSLRSNQAYKSIQPALPAATYNSPYPAFSGPASTFNAAPAAYSPFQLWYPQKAG